MAINQLQRGSTLERKAWMAKVRRMQREFRRRSGGINSDSLTALLIWGEGREKRTNKKKGGL